MTEAEWLACDDPGRMLDFLVGKRTGRKGRYRPSDRKLRLFTIAINRLAFADAHHAAEPRSYVLSALNWEEAEARDDPDAPLDESWIMTMQDAAEAARQALDWRLPRGTKSAAVQVSLLREIFGNPYQVGKGLAPAVATPTIVSLAAAAYAARDRPTGRIDPVRLGILADALEEAAAPVDVYSHLRSPELHPRGCWALDLALGKP